MNTIGNSSCDLAVKVNLSSAAGFELSMSISERNCVNQCLQSHSRFEGGLPNTFTSRLEHSEQIGRRQQRSVCDSHPRCYWIRLFNCLLIDPSPHWHQFCLDNIQQSEDKRMYHAIVNPDHHADESVHCTSQDSCTADTHTTRSQYPTDQHPTQRHNGRRERPHLSNSADSASTQHFAVVRG
jgi:hypothetical protein